MKNSGLCKSGSTNATEEIAGILAVGYLRLLISRRMKSRRFQECSEDSPNEQKNL